MRRQRSLRSCLDVPEGLSPPEVGKEIAEHREHVSAEQGAHQGHALHDRLVSIVEALLLSIVALMAAWSGYSAAKWGTESSLDLSKSSAARTKSSVAEVQATQVRTLDSVTFNAVASAYLAHDAAAYKLAVKRLRSGYRPAFDAWLATHPLTNPNAPADPSLMPQYSVSQDAQASAFSAQADALFSAGQSAAGTSDKYVRLTVLLAAVLFLVGIGSRFPLPVARYGLIAVAAALLIFSVVQLLGLPGPPSS
jgi:hypothetical protein